jgi:hypothetical protein
MPWYLYVLVLNLPKKDRSKASADLPEQVLEFEDGRKPSWKPSMPAGNEAVYCTWTSWTKQTKHTPLSLLFLENDLEVRSQQCLIIFE